LHKLITPSNCWWELYHSYELQEIIGKPSIDDLKKSLMSGSNTLRSTKVEQISAIQ